MGGELPEEKSAREDGWQRPLCKNVVRNSSTEEVEGTSLVCIVKSVLGERFSNWRAQGCSGKF